MILQMGLEHIRAKDLGILCRALAQRLDQQIAQRAAQPIMRRNIEAHLRPVQHRMRQLVHHQLLENHLLPRA